MLIGKAEDNLSTHRQDILIPKTSRRIFTFRLRDLIVLFAPRENLSY